MLVDWLRPDGPNKPGTNGNANVTDGPVFEHSKLCGVFCNAVRDGKASLMGDMSISLFVAAEHYHLFEKNSLGKELENSAKTKMTWAEEDQSCRQLTLQGTVFGIHASHLVIVKMICDHGDDAMED